MKIDWNKYSETFPDRYLETSRIDEEISDCFWTFSMSKMTSDSQKVNILDIGGGKYGTKILKNISNAEIYLLDPNIDEEPEWYNGLVTWEDIKNDKFDLIIARGSFNYLIKKEIKKIPNLLSENGIFIANSFLKPTEINRKYSKNGIISGTETSTYDKGIIYHYLIPDNGNVIEHQFYYYDLYKIIEFFSGHEITFETYGKNSVIFKVYKKSLC